MYGLVNKAIEQLVCRNHGEAIWEEIKRRANVDVEVFLSNESYPDEFTYRLVGAASEVLKTPTDDILKAFGEHWITYTAKEGYGGMLQAAGRNLPEFFANLPNFHTRVAMIFPKLHPPKFRCTDVTDRSMKLHYMTHRPGLSAFMIGLLQGVGTLFETPVTVTHLESRSQGADHDVFLLEWTPKSP
ncbi:MAG: heme NO-binding domain-containing protein [Verrucomicrobiota bacterium]